MPTSLSAGFYSQANLLFTKYPQKVHALLPLLHLAQREKGELSIETMGEVAELIQVPLTHVEGVVTFYSMFTRKKRGQHYVGVCTNVACWLRGGEKILEHVEEKLHTHAGESTADGQFFVEEVECLGACGNAPVVLGNEDYLLDVDPAKIDAWLAKTTRK